MRHKHVDIAGICCIGINHQLTLTSLSTNPLPFVDFGVFIWSISTAKLAPCMPTCGRQKIDVMAQPLAKNVIPNEGIKTSSKVLAKTVPCYFFQVLTCALTASTISPFLRAKPVSSPQQIGYDAAPA